jgi:hypothetical protein
MLVIEPATMARFSAPYSTGLSHIPKQIERMLVIEPATMARFSAPYSTGLSYIPLNTLTFKIKNSTFKIKKILNIQR